MAGSGAGGHLFVALSAASRTPCTPSKAWPMTVTRLELGAVPASPWAVQGWRSDAGYSIVVRSEVA